MLLDVKGQQVCKILAWLKLAESLVKQETCREWAGWAGGLICEIGKQSLTAVVLFAWAHARPELGMECAPDVGVGARGSVAGNVTVTVMDTLMRHHSHCTACDPV